MVDDRKPDAAAIRSLLERWTLRHSSEDELQRAIAEVLEAGGIPFKREVRIGVRDRLDFLAGTVGIECKLFGSRTEVGRQLIRYAESGRVGALLLVTTRRQLLGLPVVLAGVPLLTLHVGALR